MLPRLRLRPAKATRPANANAATAPAAPGESNALPRLRLRPAKATRCRGSGCARRKQRAAAAPAAPGESNVPGESAAHRLTQRGQRGVVVGLLHDFGDKFGMDNGA